MLYLEDIAEQLRAIFNADGVGAKLVEIVLQYGLERGGINDIEVFFKFIETQISHEAGEKIMSLARKLEEKGKAEEQQEIAKRMLKMGIEPVVISKATGLSLDIIKALK